MVLTAPVFFGGATKVSITTDLQLDYRYRVWAISANAGRTVRYPPVSLDATPLGIHVFIIVNVGSNTFTVRDFEGTDATSVVSLAANKAIIASTYPSGGGKRWAPDAGRNVSLY